MKLIFIESDTYLRTRMHQPLLGLLDLSINSPICKLLGYGNPTGSVATPARSSFAVRSQLTGFTRTGFAAPT